MIFSSVVFAAIGVFWTFVVLVVLLPTIVWIWALVDCLTGNFADTNQKLIWIVLIVMVPFLGSVLYFAVGRRKRLGR